MTVTDLDGNRFYDLTGSYGVNLFGYDFYKEMIAEGAAMVADLGPVLGAYHPVVADNVQRLQAISGLDEVSFHMSGTEAVMQAVRLARYHTRRSHLVRFCGAYHGWWGDVQPGVGNPMPADRTYTLADMSEKTLQVLATRKNIACVLVNPLQALHPNSGAPSDSTLVDSSRSAHFDREALRRMAAAAGRDLPQGRHRADLRRGVRRLPPRAAAARTNISASSPTWSPTARRWAAGCRSACCAGARELMKRFRDDRPADICFARGTFNCAPLCDGRDERVPARARDAARAALYDGLDERWNARAALLNARLAEAGLPVRVANLSTIWTVLLHAAVALQLDAAILSARRGAGAELGRHRPADLQPQLPRRRLRRGRRALRRRRRRRCRHDGWWWQRPADDQQDDPALDPARNVVRPAAAEAQR